MQAEEIRQLIEDGLAGSQVQVSGDGTHFEATVICAAFAGQTMLAQHRMVYATLGDRMQGEIHALSIHAFSPETWERARQLRVS